MLLKKNIARAGQLRGHPFHQRRSIEFSSIFAIFANQIASAEKARRYYSRLRQRIDIFNSSRPRLVPKNNRARGAVTEPPFPPTPQDKISKHFATTIARFPQNKFSQNESSPRQRIDTFNISRQRLLPKKNIARAAQLRGHYFHQRQRIEFPSILRH